MRTDVVPHSHVACCDRRPGRSLPAWIALGVPGVHALRNPVHPGPGWLPYSASGLRDLSVPTEPALLNAELAHILLGALVALMTLAQFRERGAIALVTAIVVTV